MASGTDPLQTVLTILSTDWTAANTNSKTPKFTKITGDGANNDLFKRVDYNVNQDWILAQRSRPDFKNSGIGSANKHEKDIFELDIRVKGYNQEAHYLNVVEEVKRVLATNQANPSANYQLLEFEGNAPDLSDKLHNVWRCMIPIQLTKFNISR